MDRKEFMRSVYPSYWLGAREEIYGFMQYDRRLCEHLSGELAGGGSLLEVAVGTGYPIADYFQRAGYGVRGIDISPDLVRRCVELNPAIRAEVGDAERLRFADEEFDGTYCWHSTWYFPDLYRVIDEMLRVTRAGGVIMFDLQNATNPEVAAAYERRLARIRPGLLPRLNLHARNLAKTVLRRGTPNWHAINYEVPTDPAGVLDCLRRAGRNQVEVLAHNEADECLDKVDQTGSMADYPRLVFSVRT
jgi:SAM-dependent methyltransferase